MTNFTVILAAPSPEATIAIVALSVIAFFSLLYGVFKKFSRMSWAGWQLLLIFAATLLCGLIPETANKTLAFALTVGGFLLVAAAVLGSGALIRRAMRNYAGKPPLAARVFDRILGALTALVDWILFFAVAGGFALAIVFYCVPSAAEQIAFVYENPLWTGFGAKYALDLALIFFLLFAVKGGYRVGFVKSLWTVLAVALTVVAFAGSLYLATHVSFLVALAQKISAACSNLNSIVANVIGYGVTALVCFIVFFVVLVLFFILVNYAVRGLNKFTAFNVFDGILLSIVFFAVAAAVVCGLDYGVRMIAADASGALGSFGETAAEAGRRIEALFTSSPLSAIFYECNPILVLTGN